MIPLNCRFEPKKSKQKKPRAKKVDTFLPQEIKTEVGKVDMTLPIRLKNEANCFESWRTKHARHKQQKQVIALVLSPHIHNISLPCVIELTRYAPKTLDSHDNLPYSFKWVSDSISNALIPGKKAGQADSDPRISWKFYQIKSSCYGIHIKITSIVH